MNYGPASKYYDQFGSKKDIDFYRKLAIEHGKKALELGVGTGRVAIELARAGVTVCGIDNSKYMIAVAKEKLRKEKTSVKRRLILELADMRNFKLEETFPFVYIASSTFEHCVTDKDQRGCLTSAYNALTERGVLAFDISRLDQGKPENSWWIDKAELGADEEVVRTIFSRRSPKTSLVSVNLFFEVYRGGRLRERYYEYGEARISSKEDVEKILKAVGFRNIQVYGNFDKSAYNQESQKVIFLATRT